MLDSKDELMQIHAPDSVYTSSADAHADFVVARRITVGFVALIWLIQLSGWALDVGPGDSACGHGSGRDSSASSSHRSCTTVSRTCSRTRRRCSCSARRCCYLYPTATPWVLPAVWLGPGLAVWLLARGGVHIGASGLVYGLLGYIFVAGLLRRDRRAIAASLLVCFMYGALVWGVLPIRTRVSWETHLAAAVIGVVLALALRRTDIPPRRRYSWEDEPAGSDEWGQASATLTPPPSTRSSASRRRARPSARPTESALPAHAPPCAPRLEMVIRWA